MNLFIDTNVFLSFFHFSSDDLEELKKLGLMVRRGSVRLLLPAQVRAEFRRNRDGKVADALKRLREQKLAFQFPQVCKEYEEYEPLRAALLQAEHMRSQLIEKLEADMMHRRLKADGVIDELFALGQDVAQGETVLARARERMTRGNPPGKKGSYGDAMNWEALLESVPEKEDLFFISGDTDWLSPLAEERFDSFLVDEWTENKGSSVRYYGRLSSFLRQHFPDISLASEEEKEILIQALQASRKFASSRVTLQKLATHSDFSDDQLDSIVRAAITNNQIYWIAGDADISRYLRGLIAGQESRIDPETLAELKKLLGD